MNEPRYNTCPRCIASGVGACDDYPRCQPDFAEPVRKPPGFYDAEEAERAREQERIARLPEYAHMHDDDGFVEGCPGCMYDESLRPDESTYRERHGNEPVSDYIVTRDGGFMQLMPIDIDYDALRAKLAEATPEERIAASQHYMRARYDEAVIRGIERVTGEIYDPETGSWALPPDK